jgi:hypothetical protein
MRRGGSELAEKCLRKGFEFAGVAHESAGNDESRDQGAGVRASDESLTAMKIFQKAGNRRIVERPDEDILQVLKEMQGGNDGRSLWIVCRNVRSE